MRKVALLIFVIFTLTGCIAPETKEESPAPVSDINETPPPIHTTEFKSSSCQECHDFYWPRFLDIPVYRQESENWCGQAVVQMTLAYYGINKTQKQIAEEMEKLDRTYPHDIAGYLEGQGFNAYVLELGDERWDDFEPYAGKYPVIVEDDGEVVVTPSHWMLLKGRGELGYVWIDPETGGESYWLPSENYTVIVVEN